PLFDQSLFVRASVSGVVREATIAAILTGLMILLFLGSWRSTFIVCTSIPLSILTSLAVLSLLGQTINVMTLGGLALAVGILVDDATVEIENTHRNIAMRKPLARAVLDGASQIAVPLYGTAQLVAAPSSAGAERLHDRLHRFIRPRVAHRPGFLSERRFRPDEITCTRPRWYAYRRNRSAILGDRARNPRRGSARR